MSYYDQAIRGPLREYAAQLGAMAAPTPDVVYNPNYYNTANGQAELRQRGEAVTSEHLRNLQNELQRQSQMIQDGSQVFSPEDQANRRTQIQDSISTLTGLSPLAAAGVLSPTDVNVALRTTAMGDVAGQRTERRASQDWNAIEQGSRSFMSETQMAGAVQSFEKEYGPQANLIPGYLAYKGNLAPPVSNADFLPLSNKLFNTVPGVAPQAASKARSDYIQAAGSISRPGVTKQEAAAVQENFAKLHPDFAQQIGTPQPMGPDQLKQLGSQAELASAQEASDGAPMIRGQKGEIIANPGWVAAQKAKREEATQTHLQGIEERRFKLDYLKHLDPGKEPIDALEQRAWQLKKLKYDAEVSRLIPSPTQTQSPGGEGTQSGLTNIPARAEETVDRSNLPQSFNDGARAEEAFRNGQLPQGKQFIVRGKRLVFDKDGNASPVQ